MMKEGNDKKVFKAHIQYCGGWPAIAAKHGLILKQILENYQNANIVEKRDWGMTGNYVITLNDEYKIYDRKAMFKRDGTSEVSIDELINRMDKVLLTV